MLLSALFMALSFPKLQGECVVVEAYDKYISGP